MTSIASLVPNPADFVSLDVEQAAGVLLVHLNSYTDRESVVVQGDLINRRAFFDQGPHYPDYPSYKTSMNQALMEAWSWLEGQGLLVRDPGQPADWYFLSRRAKELKSREAFQAYRKRSGPRPSGSGMPAPTLRSDPLPSRSEMNWIRDLRLHVDALLSAMENNKRLFAAVMPYVAELARVVRLPRTEVAKASFVAPVKTLIEFYAGYERTISPDVSNTRTTVGKISDLITKLTSLPDDEFAACFQLSSGRGGTPQQPPETARPTAIFIGHGGSKEWLELEKYLTRELHLNCEEFNAKPAAGYTTQQHLEEMLDRATFAFLLMTAEDKHEDGTFHARENVVHEAGLFQGKLRFSDAVLLVEAGCSLPSNFDGLAYIPFPKDNIAGAFHEVRRTLEDRGIVRGF